MEFSREIHKRVIRTSTILTGSYVAGNVIADASEYNTLALEVDYTKGSLTTMELKIEVSNDGTNYFQQPTEATSSGTITITPGEREFTTGAPTKYAILVTPIRAKYIKISVKGTGTLTNSLCAINAYLSWS